MLLKQFLISSIILIRFSCGKVLSSDDGTNGNIGIVEPEWKKVKGTHSRFLTAHHILQKDQILGDREIPGRNISRLKPTLIRKYTKIRSRKNILPYQQEAFHKKQYSTSYRKEVIPGHSNNGSFNRIKIIQIHSPAVRHSVDSSHLPDALLLYPARKTSEQSRIDSPDSSTTALHAFIKVNDGIDNVCSSSPYPKKLSFVFPALWNNQK